VHELAQWLADPDRSPPLLLDVREEWEFEHAHVSGAYHLPMTQIASQLNTLEETAEIVCICHHGIRSMQVAGFLSNHGFTQVFNLTGGIDAWAQEVDRAMPRY